MPLCFAVTSKILCKQFLTTALQLALKIEKKNQAVLGACQTDTEDRECSQQFVRSWEQGCLWRLDTALGSHATPAAAHAPSCSPCSSSEHPPPPLALHRELGHLCRAVVAPLGPPFTCSHLSRARLSSTNWDSNPYTHSNAFLSISQWKSLPAFPGALHIHRQYTPFPFNGKEYENFTGINNGNTAFTRPLTQRSTLLTPSPSPHKSVRDPSQALHQV